MTLSIALLFIISFGMLAIGIPVSLSLLSGSIVYILLEGIPELIIIQRLLGGINSFPLLAVPFFIFAGALMNESKVTNLIFDFAKSIAGWLRGGLGYVNVFASVIFSGMSGAAVADAGGLGSMEIKAMRDAGYDDKFSVGVTASSSIIGPIIPPSLPLVIYGVTASVSIGQLFIAGIVPGLLMALSLSVMIYWLARRRGYPRDSKFSLCRVAVSFRKAIWALVTPVIIVGGILSGAFTPTESAIAAVAYVLFLGTVVYRTLSLKKIWSITLETAETTGNVLLIVASAAVFTWILTVSRVTEQFSAFMLNLTDNRLLLLLFINIVVLIVGVFMETIAGITILVPVLLPIAISLGVDPVHFGIIVILNLMIGLLTPPVGMVLYVLTKVAKVRFEVAVMGTLPFLAPLLVILLLITYFPNLSLWLPRLVYP